MKSNKFSRLIKHYFWILVLIIISVFPLLPLFQNGMFIAHDTQDHVARIANFYQSLKEGILIPRWAGNLNWGYGHPILMFLYPLPSYVASLFHLFGLSLVDSTKLVYALGFIGSGITMYLWIRRIWGSNAGLLAGIFYMFAPYRFVDLYVRGAIGENLFFIFPPLTCYLVSRLIETKRFVYLSLTSLSIGAMILSHNALTIMFLPFIAFYSVVLIYKGKNLFQESIRILTSFLLGIGISSFFLLPAYFEGKYTLRDIVIKNEIFNRFETIFRLVYSTWNFGGSGQLSVEIGIMHWMVVITSIIFIVFLFFRKHDKKTRVDKKFFFLFFLAFVFFWISILLMLPISRGVYELFTILQKFQFPWRFLSLSVFSCSVLAGFLTHVFLSKRNKISIGVGLLVIVLTVQFWSPKGFTQKSESFYSEVYEGTTDTGESAPIWSVRFMEKRPKDFAEIVEGKASIDVNKRTSVVHEYNVQIESSTIRFLENTLYFPGWHVYVDGNEVPSDKLYFMDPNYRGLINFYVDSPGTKNIRIEFKETKLRSVSNIISSVSGIILICLFIADKVILKRKFV
jgi:hypothetical protein